jgi:hypothetical protein
MATISSERLARIFVEVADSLIDEFDPAEFLHRLTVRVADLIDAWHIGILFADQQGQLPLVAASDEAATAPGNPWSTQTCAGRIRAGRIRAGRIRAGPGSYRCMPELRVGRGAPTVLCGLGRGNGTVTRSPQAAYSSPRPGTACWPPLRAPWY